MSNLFFPPSLSLIFELPKKSKAGENGLKEQEMAKCGISPHLGGMKAIRIKNIKKKTLSRQLNLDDAQHGSC